jgi:nucleotide-binding universal stress UspA family protein
MKILLPIDSESDRAIAAANAVTTIPNAAEVVEVLILNVENKINVTGEDGGMVKSKDWYDESDFPQSVQQALEVLEKAGISTKKRREHGDSAETIINVANEINADRIIMAGRNQTPVGKVLFGSVTQAVLLNARKPVTVIPK